MPRLLVVIASTRPGRVGSSVGRWFEAQARAHGGFDVHVADLAEIRLPLLDEPEHPRMRRYTHQHTKDWSARVDAADAIAFVMPEYNYGYTAPLKNAIDYLFHEWAYKPVGLVSYGGVSGGTRAQQLIKPVLVCLRMFPAGEGVVIPFVRRFLTDDGVFGPNESVAKAAVAMLDEMLRLHAALEPLRAAAAR